MTTRDIIQVRSHGHRNPDLRARRLTAVTSGSERDHGSAMLTTLLVTALVDATPTPPPSPYTVPTAADLKQRFPAFAGVPNSVIDYWILDAQGIVTTGWGPVDYRPGIMELAAHNMVMSNVPGIATDAVGGLAAKGVTSFKSASFSVDLDASAAKRASGTGYDATTYGAQFKVRLERNCGGPFLVGGWC